MRRVAAALLCLVLACRAAPEEDDERLPGWLGEVSRGAATPEVERWIEPIAWRPRCALLRLSPARPSSTHAATCKGDGTRVP